jgi:DNA mismatch endonuclease (patch repair protein)
MVDVLTHEQRSYNMSRIRSKWAKQERIIHNYLKGCKIRHKMHPTMTGNPDILFKSSKTVVFIDGCFWHKCPKCYKEPKSNTDFWLPKIERNVKRDRYVNRMLKKDGWRVIRIWEHEIKKDLKKCADKLIKEVG